MDWKQGVASFEKSFWLESRPTFVTTFDTEGRRSPSITIEELQFVHIPKTGGSAVEETGRENNINWGYHSYHNPMNTAMWPMGCPPWHIPPRTYFNVLKNFSLHPYTNKTLFTVVRNPWTRILSEYYYVFQFLKKRKGNSTHDKAMLNKYVKQQIRAVIGSNETMKRYYRSDGHWIPQSDYIYDSTGSGRQIVEYVLRYEHLASDLAWLLGNVTVPSGSINGDNKRQRFFNYSLPKVKFRKTSKKLTPADFTPETVQMIQEYYRKDFENLGYSFNWSR